MSILSDLGGGIGDFFSGVKEYVTVAMIIIIVLLSLGFYFYYNYASNKIQVEVTDNQVLQNSFNTEKSTLESVQKQNANLLAKITQQQQRNNQISKINSDLMNKLSTYDYLNNAKTNATATENDVNATFHSITQSLVIDSNPNQFNSKAIKAPK